MGQVSRKLAGRFDTNPRDLRTLRREIDTILSGAALSPDPVHKAYVRVQNITSVFAETVSHLAEFKPYFRTVSEALEEYMPSYPPMSPLTHSYFTLWAFYDLRFGRDHETIGTVLLDVGEHLRLSPDDFTVASQFQQTRMGLYEYCGPDGGRHRLRELMTDEEFVCFVSSGYVGQAGQLWYVRLGPPIKGYDYHATLTTPYVLQRTTRTDWLDYLDRSLETLTGDSLRTRLHHLLKYGRHPNGWNEFIFQGYCGHRPDAIFLAGIPDRPATLPHGDTTGRRPYG